MASNLYYNVVRQTKTIQHSNSFTAIEQNQTTRSLEYGLRSKKSSIANQVQVRKQNSMTNNSSVESLRPPRK